MIETAQMLVNLDAILSAEGLDAISIGPSVLPLSLGCKPMFDDVEPRAQAAIEHIVKRAKAHGVFAAIHNGRVDAAQARVDPGFRFVALPSEARLPAVGRRNCWGRWGPMGAGLQLRRPENSDGPGIAAWAVVCWWALQDSNLRPTD